MGNEMDLVDIFGVKTVNIMKVSGKIINKMAAEKWFYQMAVEELGNSKMDSLLTKWTKKY